MAAVTTYYASQLEPVAATPARPDVLPPALHAALSALQLRHPSIGSFYSLFASRIHFVPYQFRPVLKLIQADRPRLLIADEVGVGKTIEAGLILKELQARREIRSVLVICPKPLVAERKWLEELKRFDEQFVHLDGRALRYCIDETHLDGVWPQQYARAILPYSLLDENLLMGKQQGRKKQRGLLDLDPPPPSIWSSSTRRITSATPTLGPTATCATSATTPKPSFCSPPHPSNWATTISSPCCTCFAQTFCPAGWNSSRWPSPIRTSMPPSKRREALAMAGRTRSLRRSTKLPRPLGDAVSCLRTVACSKLGTCSTGDDDSPEARINLIGKLEALHTFAPFINRTRRRDIGNFTTRKPETVAVPYTPEQESLHDDLLNLIARILAYRHGTAISSS